jgi:hypothetical protein
MREQHGSASVGEVVQAAGIRVARVGSVGILVVADGQGWFA